MATFKRIPGSFRHDFTSEFYVCFRLLCSRYLVGVLPWSHWDSRHLLWYAYTSSSRRKGDAKRWLNVNCTKITRVKVKRKQPKKTVGITLPTYIIEESRNKNLNIRRITEQVLLSILEYYPQETRTESSINFLSRGSFPKESRARSSVRLERRTLNP